LPDVEVWKTSDPVPVRLPDIGPKELEWYTDPGFYYAYGFPGCLWDSDPVGPFDTEEEALEAAREAAGMEE